MENSVVDQLLKEAPWLLIPLGLIVMWVWFVRSKKELAEARTAHGMMDMATEQRAISSELKDLTSEVMRYGKPTLEQVGQLGTLYTRARTVFSGPTRRDRINKLFGRELFKRSPVAHIHQIVDCAAHLNVDNTMIDGHQSEQPEDQAIRRTHTKHHTDTMTRLRELSVETDSKLDVLRRTS